MLTNTFKRLPRKLLYDTLSVYMSRSNLAIKYLLTFYYHPPLLVTIGPLHHYPNVSAYLLYLWLIAL
jgi:hypothetical protein